MTHPRDARNLHSVEWRERLAESVARGITEFAKLGQERVPPKLLADFRAENAAKLAGSSHDYQPLEGISRLMTPKFSGLSGWRKL